MGQHVTMGQQRSKSTLKLKHMRQALSTLKLRLQCALVVTQQKSTLNDRHGSKDGLGNPQTQRAQLTLDVINGLGQSADIVGSNTGDGNTTILGSVDRELLGKLPHLLSSQAGIGEHADLARDV